MSQKPRSRVLIILWKWKELKDKDLAYDEIGISNDENAKIIRVNEAKKDSLSDIFQKIGSALKLSKCDVILKLHSSALRPVDWEKITIDFSSDVKSIFPEPVFFSGGETYIYYQSKYDAGLLDQDQGFAIDEFVFHQDPDSGKEIRQQMSVVDWEDDRQSYTVKKNYFDAVWYYYQYQPKQRFFELKENLFIHLIGCNATQHCAGVKLSDFLANQNHFLSAELLDLSNKAWWSTRLADFYQEKELDNIIKYYYSWVDFINERTFDENYLINLRGQFANLLTAIPKPIYG